ELSRVVRPGLLGGPAQRGLRDRLRRGRLLGLRGLLDQRERDVRVGVFLVRPDELAQVHLVGDRDLRLGPALLGRLLGLLRVLLALGEAAPFGRGRGGRRAGARGTARPGGRAGASRLARTRGTAADGTGAGAAGRRVVHGG